MAGYGDTITVKAKSKINGVMPVIKIYKKNPVTEEVQSSGLDIYVLLDVSRSMDVEDVAPSRLKKVKK